MLKAVFSTKAMLINIAQTVTRRKDKLVFFKLNFSFLSSPTNIFHSCRSKFLILSSIKFQNSTKKLGFTHQKHLLLYSTAAQQEALTSSPYAAAGCKLCTASQKAFRPADNSPSNRHCTIKGNAQSSTLLNKLILLFHPVQKNKKAHLSKLLPRRSATSAILPVVYSTSVSHIAYLV